MNYPERVILNTATCVARFRQRVERIFDPEDLREGFVENYVQDLFSFVRYLEAADVLVAKYVRTQVGHWVKHTTEVKVDQFEAALLDLANELISVALRYDLYTRKGFIPYSATELLNNDLILDYCPEYMSPKLEVTRNAKT